MLSSHTSSTQVNPFRFTVNGDGSWLDVRQPASVRMPLRVAYVMSILNPFATEVTSSSQFLNSFVKR